MNDPNVHRDLLVLAGRLLLEYNASTKTIEDQLTSTARALAEKSCTVVTSYRSIAVSLEGEAPLVASIRELRNNAALQRRVHEVLGAIRRGDVDAETALNTLRTLESDTPRHARSVSATLLGAAAASLAVLLGADVEGAAVAGIATALGVVARHELGRRHAGLLTLPFTAAIIGALFGGLAIRLNWTQTPELVLIVPALVLVPGPHLINGLLDLVDNYVPMSLARLGLAGGILIANATGIFLGAMVTLPIGTIIEPQTNAAPLNVFTDALLAGIATVGFAVFFNTVWRHIPMAALGGMAGHALRFVALEAGLSMEASTLLGGLAVGLVSGWMLRSHNVPVALIGFAGAVTMIPGLHIYRALAGAVRLAREGAATDPAMLASTLGFALQSCLVVFGLTLGLLLGARIVPSAKPSAHP